MLTSMSIVSWAEVCRLSSMRLAMVFLMPRTGMVWSSPRSKAGVGALAAASTSSLVMRPPGPVPYTCAKSTPSSRASLRAMGEEGAGPEGLGCAAAAAWTSASTMRPPGPLPMRPTMSTFSSPANLRAAGDDRMRPSAGEEPTAEAAPVGASAAPASAASAVAAAAPPAGSASGTGSSAA